jgi:hypothetical protein
VKILLKSLIVWLMLVAIPFQGFASATKLVCAPMQSSPQIAKMAEASAGHHDHHATVNAAQLDEPDHHTATQADSDDHTAAHHHTGGKCNSCATCCFGAAMASSYASRVLAEVQHVTKFPFELDRVASVDLALPERPPQTSLT